MLWGFAIPSHQNSKRITDCRNLKHDSFSYNDRKIVNRFLSPWCVTHRGLYLCFELLETFQVTLEKTNELSS